MGHSTRSLEEVVALLRHHGVDLLVDVRTIPASRRMPHFAKAALERSLPVHGIEYVHMPELGGLRKPKPDSTNLGLRNVGFRGYADHMQTEEFVHALDRLTRPPVGAYPAGGKVKQIAIMCAEAVPWRCHRSLISDALVARGVEVRHIVDMGEPVRHRLTESAVIERGRVTYPPPDKLPL